MHVERSGSGGSPLVLVHGWALSARAFAPQLDALAARHRVLAVDLAGHGRSAAPVPGRPHGIEEHAADLAALVEGEDLRGAVLVGWSVGGQIALAALPRVRHRVAGLALLDATPCFCERPGWSHGVPAANVRTMAERLRTAFEPTLRRFFANLFAPGELPPGRKEELERSVLDAVPRPAPEALHALLDALEATDQRPLLGRVRTPTLVVHGELDRTCAPGAGEALAAGIPGARLERLAGVAHAPQLSRPELVNELLARFAAERAHALPPAAAGPA